MPLALRIYGDPVLREKANPVSDVTPSIGRLAGDMVETMRAEHGVGLAAQQIGRTESICVVEVPPEFDVDEDGNRQHPNLGMPLVLLNPEVSDPSRETDRMEEGCLSFPEIKAPIRRPFGIRLRYDDLEGTPHNIPLQGFLARVVQHEIDHLNGILFIDRMTPVKKAALSGRLKRMRKETRDRMDV
jgi:peptide deformylase